MPAILDCYSNMGKHYIHDIVIQIWIGIIFMNHEYNAYPYLNNNKVWPVHEYNAYPYLNNNKV